MVLVEKRLFRNWSLFIVFLFLFILMCTLLGLTTLRPVSQSDYAVEYNNYTCEFGRVLEQGKYTTDIGVTLMTFQRTLQDLRLGEQTCLTSDQVLIELDVNMQVQYYRDELIPTILMRFDSDKNYKDFLGSLAKSTILNTCLKFSSNDFYSKRSIVDVEMTTELQQTITKQFSGSSVEFFQLINIKFPESYKDLILQKQTTQQRKVTLTNNRQNDVTLANTRLKVANNTANIKLIQAQQQSQSILNKAIAESGVVEAFWDNRAEVYKSVMLNFKFNSTDQLVSYVKSETVRQQEGKVVASIKG